MADEHGDPAAPEGGVGTLSGAAAWRQMVLLLAAAAAGSAALYFNYAENWSEDFQDWLASHSPWLRPVLVAVGLAVICAVRDRFFAGTGGTGIPQAIAALKLGEGPGRSQLLSLRIAFGKALLLTLGMFAGATIGREGPSVHVGACLLYLTTRVVRLPRPLVDRGLILAGGAAGIGAAFNAPLAAIVFSFEEIGRSFEKSNAGTIIRTVVVACLVCWIPLSDYTFYGEVDTHLGSPLNWLVVAAVGLGGGILGGCFARGVVEVSAAVRRASSRRPYTVAAALGVALALIGILSGGQSYGGGYPQAQAILIQGRDLPVWYPLAKAAGSFVSLVSAIPGGLFDPSLSVGAALGQLTWAMIPEMDRATLILLVMGAYFAGVVQSPITAAVILVEMTGARHLLLPLLATTVLAYSASRLVCPVSLYEALALTFLGEKTAA